MIFILLSCRPSCFRIPIRCKSFGNTLSSSLLSSPTGSGSVWGSIFVVAPFLSSSRLVFLSKPCYFWAFRLRLSDKTTCSSWLVTSLFRFQARVALKGELSVTRHIYKVIQRKKPDPSSTSSVAAALGSFFHSSGLPATLHASLVGGAVVASRVTYLFTLASSFSDSCQMLL